MTALRGPAPHLLGFSTALLLAATASAAPEDRGPRGWYVGAGGGVILGQASDSEGRDPGSFFGSGGRLRVGDEALPGLGIGLSFYGGGGTGDNEAYTSSFGGLLLEVSWRPLPERLPAFVGRRGPGLGGGALPARAPRQAVAPAGRHAGRPPRRPPLRRVGAGRGHRRRAGPRRDPAA
ncbi:MAG: hypothetical protein R3F60_28135 [bacterium]